MMKGFTLIEILVSISILAILFGVVLTSLSTLQRNSRDAQRVTDLRKIQAALAQYYADQGFYPTSINFGGTYSLTNNTGNPNVPSPVKTYLNRVPADPYSTTNQYWYVSLPNSCNNTGNPCTSYCLYAMREFIADSGTDINSCLAPTNPDAAVYRIVVTLP